MTCARQSGRYRTCVLGGRGCARIPHNFWCYSGGCRHFSLFPRLSAVSHRFHCGITVKMGVKFSGPDSFHTKKSYDEHTLFTPPTLLTTTTTRTDPVSRRRRADRRNRRDTDTLTSHTHVTPKLKPKRTRTRCEQSDSRTPTSAQQGIKVESGHARARAPQTHSLARSYPAGRSHIHVA